MSLTPTSQSTEVEARFGVDGHITVLSFTWRGRRRRVLSHGRRWDGEDGLHFLVMTAGDKVFELLYQPLSGRWRIARTPDSTVAA